MLSVMPTNWTRLVSWWMAITHHWVTNRSPCITSTAVASMAAICSACDSRKVRQSLSSLRSGAGPTSWPRRMLRTLLSDTVTPMAASLRTMPGAPTRGFSRAMRNTACTVSAGSGGRPGPPVLG